MAATIILDTIDGSTLDDDRNSRRRVRGGLIKGLECGGGVDDFEVLEEASGLLPSMYSVFPGDTSLDPFHRRTLVRRRIYPARSGTTARFELVYETPQFFQIGGPAGEFIFRDSTRLVSETTNMLPGTRHPIEIEWENPDEAGDKGFDHAVITFMRPVRVLDFSGTIYGGVPSAQQAGIGRVNSAPWMGLPKGYWLMTGYETFTRDGGETHQVTASTMTRLNEDWSRFAAFRSKMTGGYLRVDPADVAELLALGYSDDAPKRINRNGLVRVDPYPVSDFAAIFGFGGL